MKKIRSSSLNHIDLWGCKATGEWFGRVVCEGFHELGGMKPGPTPFTPMYLKAIERERQREIICSVCSEGPRTRQHSPQLPALRSIGGWMNGIYRLQLNLHMYIRKKKREREMIYKVTEMPDGKGGQQGSLIFWPEMPCSC